MQVKELTSLIEDYAPLCLQEDYDNAGLLCGDPSAEVRSVLLTTDITEEVIEEALEARHNLIISHHPLMLKGIKKLIPDNQVSRCLIKAIQNNLNIYTAHTNMDAVFQGVSGRMADKLNLQNRRILQAAGKLYSLTFYTPADQAEKVREAVLQCGGGSFGNYSHCSFNNPGEGMFQPENGSHPYVGETGKIHVEREIRTEITVPEYLLDKSIRALISAHPYEEPVWNVVCLNNVNPITGFGILGELETETDTLELLQSVKQIFRCGVVRHTDLCKPTVKRIAVCGGSGAFLTQAAINAGADVYITGDYKYHDFFNADNRIVIADIGHYESEQYTKEIFYEIVTKKISNFAVRFSKVKTNPINYL